MLGNRASQHSFAKAPVANIQRSKFDRSFTHKGTFDFDRLNPIFIDEVLPGDTANVSLSTFMRLATQKVPIMDNMYVDFFYFFVPSRLLWNNYERFMGAKASPGDSTSFLVPQIVVNNPNGVIVGTIGDMFGIPTGIDHISFNSLPFRAYRLIWNEWFRADQIQASLTVPKDDGPDSLADLNSLPLLRGKRHDYFTSANPSPQSGPAINIPTSSGQIIGAGNGVAVPLRGITSGTNASMVWNNTVGLTTGLGMTNNEAMGFPDGQNVGLSIAPNALGTINQLREAFQIQVFFEAEARGGVRFTEILTQHFNVVAEDFRLQRPEYLGGGQLKLNSHPVAQTAPTDGDNAQAQLAAFATGSGNNIGFTKSFVEPGYVIGLACARADITYQQGLHRMWSRRSRFDFFWPEFQNLGEQAVLQKEIYTTGTSADEDVFGYQERNAEYRYKPSQITGEFRSTFAQSLDFWHMAEEFMGPPALNSTFMVSNTPIERAIAVTDAPHLLFDGWFRYIHTRPMVTYAVPMSLGRM